MFCGSETRKQGSSLLFALFVVVVFGIWAGLFYRLVYAERMEALRRHTKAQEELSALSRLEYGLHKMRASQEPWRGADSLLAHTQHGVYSVLATPGLPPMLAGRRLRNFPALVLFDPNASVALAGGGRVMGDVALRRGTVEKSSHYTMRANADATWEGTLLADSLPLWDTLAVFAGPASLWLEDKLKQTEAQDDCLWDGLDTVRGTHFCAKAVFQGDAFCDSCAVFAKSVAAAGAASLRKALLAAQKVELAGSGQMSGQFFARDTLAVDLESEQISHSVFAVNGRKDGAASYAGRLVLRRFSGPGVAVFLGENWDASLPGISVALAQGVSLRGLVLAHGNIELKGKVRGSVVAWNLALEEDGALWQGYLKDGVVEHAQAGMPAPDAWMLGGRAAYAPL
jgi:hypothetical protein